MDIKDKSKYIFFKETATIEPEFNRNWKVTDKRRKLMYVEFSNGTIWFPKDIEIELIIAKKHECWDHNKQYPNIDPKEEVK